MSGTECALLSEMRTRAWTVRPRLLFVTLATAGLAVAALGGLGDGTMGSRARIVQVAVLPEMLLGAWQNERLPGTISNDRQIRLGSIGSDIFHDPRDPPDEFWAVTDRGPNGKRGGRRTFPVPAFDPAILHVKARGDRIEVLDALPLRKPDGSPVTGLPNVAGFDETPWSFNATEALPFNPNGLDPEGIVRTADGSFWLADEYSPSLVHVDSHGYVVERIVPVDSPLTGTSYPVRKQLPEIFNTHRQNRGFEGIALTPDGTIVFLGLQSPLDNPNRTIGRASRNTRILRVDLASRRVTGEFVYRFDDVCAFTGRGPGCGAPRGAMNLSSMAALSATTLIVDEQTDNIAKIYRVDVASASNTLDSAWDKTTTRPSLESLADPASAGVAALVKDLVIDLSRLPGIPKKIEGIAVVDADTLAIANDNDFGLAEDTVFDDSGNTRSDTGAKSQIVFIRFGRNDFFPAERGHTGPTSSIRQTGPPR